MTQERQSAVQASKTELYLSEGITLSMESMCQFTGMVASKGEADRHKPETGVPLWDGINVCFSQTDVLLFWKQAHWCH